MRTLIIDMLLATDLAVHFEQLAQITSGSARPLDVHSASGAEMLSEMIVKQILAAVENKTVRQLVSILLKLDARSLPTACLPIGREIETRVCRARVG